MTVTMHLLHEHFKNKSVKDTTTVQSYLMSYEFLGTLKGSCRSFPDWKDLTNCKQDLLREAFPDGI